MSGEQQSIGMMEGAFFVPKGDLLLWVNSTLHLEITKIEQMGTGAIYCSIVDAMFPGKVAMQRVNWKARNEWEFIANYKILQQAFAKCKIQKYIDIEKLSKSKYQDNLEFTQWMKRYFDLNNKNDLAQYDPVNARKHADVDFTFVQMRNPKMRERESLKNLKKSKSPYQNVKPKINNRSLTVSKPSKEPNNYYFQKIFKIKKIIMKNEKSKDKLQQIQQILQEIEQETPNNGMEEDEIMEELHMETVPSKVLEPAKKVKTMK